MMMVMLVAVAAQIITGYTIPEVQFFHHMQLIQQLQCPVHGGKTDFRAFSFTSMNTSSALR